MQSIFETLLSAVQLGSVEFHQFTKSTAGLEYAVVSANGTGVLLTRLLKQDSKHFQSSI